MSEINFFFEDIQPLYLDKQNIKKWISDAILNEEKNTGIINYIFCSDNYILNINKEYLNHNYYTDIITFNYNEENYISGDIFISLDTVKSNAEEFNQPFEKELHRVIIHGILHLCGYNDKTEEELFEMRQKEDFYLNLLP